MTDDVSTAETLLYGIDDKANSEVHSVAIVDDAGERIVTTHYTTVDGKRRPYSKLTARVTSTRNEATERIVEMIKTTLEKRLQLPAMMKLAGDLGVELEFMPWR